LATLKILKIQQNTEIQFTFSNAFSQSSWFTGMPLLILMTGLRDGCGKLLREVDQEVLHFWFQGYSAAICLY
jgi:hypothetical protein